MPESKRAFIFGAGFSKPAGMPLATGLLPLLSAKLEIDDVRAWLDGLRDRLGWLSRRDRNDGPLALNIEEVFHYAHFGVEVHRLRQHLAPVGREDGPRTPWNQAESIQTWLSCLEDGLRDVILECDEASDLQTIDRWAKNVSDRDAVLTFNYDTLVERSLSGAGKAWNHGTGRGGDDGIPVFKLHGSIDWIVAHRSESFPNMHLLFDKPNANRADGKTGSIEDDCRLWRCQSAHQLKSWMQGREPQRVSKGASARSVGIAGLGAYKELHQIPGLGGVWARGMEALYRADYAVVVGFSMSDFDAMAQMQFAEVARARASEWRPLPVTVIDPSLNEAAKERFQRVFDFVHFLERAHEELDWSTLT